LFVIMPFLFMRFLLVFVLLRHCKWRRFVPESKGYTRDLRWFWGLRCVEWYLLVGQRVGPVFKRQAVRDRTTILCCVKSQKSADIAPQRKPEITQRKHIFGNGLGKIDKCDNQWWQKDRHSRTNLWGCRNGSFEGAMVLLFIIYQEGLCCESMAHVADTEFKSEVHGRNGLNHRPFGHFLE
jgi:hypothetical protein